MLYRKSPPTPTRMLLRVAAVAGAGALAGACSSSSSGGTMGVGFIPLGSMPGMVDTDSGTDAGNTPVCGGHICGSIAIPPDAAADAGPDATDGGMDADTGLPCGNGVCGSIVMPQDAAPDTHD